MSKPAPKRARATTAYDVVRELKMMEQRLAKIEEAVTTLTVRVKEVVDMVAPPYLGEPLELSSEALNLI